MVYVCFQSVHISKSIIPLDEELNRHGDLCLVDFDRKLYEVGMTCVLNPTGWVCHIDGCVTLIGVSH